MQPKNLDKYPNLARYFTPILNKQTFDWKNFPIVLRWVDKDGDLCPALKIIDDKVGYLYKHGATQKIKEWFNVKNIYGEVNISAERYLLDFLRKKNCEFVEIFKGPGVDALIGKIGIEVTVFDETQIDWIFRERLLMYFFINEIKLNHAYEIKYPFENLEKYKYKIREIFAVVEEIGKEIVKLEASNARIVDNKVYRLMKMKKGYRNTISWKFPVSCNKNLVDFLIKKTKDKLSDPKKLKQFQKNENNLVYICLNFINSLGFYPDQTTFIKELNKPIRYIEETKKLALELSKILPKNVSGVCFFEYSINKEDLYYELKMFNGGRKKVPTHKA